MAIKIDVSVVCCARTENERNFTTSKTKHVKTHKIAWKIDSFALFFLNREKWANLSECHIVLFDLPLFEINH